MALSGTLSTSVCDGHYTLKANWSATQSVANNKSTVTVTLYLINDWGLDIGSRSGTITINGTAKSITSSSISSKGTHTLGSATVDVPHNSDGTKSFTIAISWNMQATISGYGYQGTLSASKSFTLTPIPRYATSVQSLKTATETSITINWSSDTTINYIWYSTNNGSTWTAVGSVNAKSGSYTISGLSAGTTYSIKTRVRSSSSSLTTDSSALSVTTYQYPYVSAVGTSNLTIGNSQTLTLYNPLGRSVTVYMRFSTASGTTLYSKSSITGTSHEFTPAAATLYAAIPSAKSGTAIYYCEYDGHRVSTKSGTFTINTSACTPTMGDPTYADTNTTTIGYTGSNQKIIQSKSIVRFTVGSVSTKNSATVSSVKVTVNGNTYTMSASGSTYTGGNAAINASTNVSATVTVTDSRGLTASKSVTVSMLAWSAPTGTVTLSRHLGYYAQTTLKCVAKFSSWSGVTTNNSITIRYTAKHDSTTLSGTLTNNVATTLNCDKNYSWTFTITITDLFTATTITKILGKGAPAVFIDTERGSLSVDGFPAGSKSIYISGNEIYHPGNKPTYSDVGAAAASHNHSAGNITSGTLDIARIPTITVAKGGTGATSAANARTNLGVLSGTWTPTFVGTSGNSYISKTAGSATGWYIKIGLYVILGFSLHNCSFKNSNSARQYLGIKGLPYAPNKSYLHYGGGGHAQGFTMNAADNSFTGWVLDTSASIIYGRAWINAAKPGNDYIGIPAKTTATGCYASGTLSYIATS